MKYTLGLLIFCLLFACRVVKLQEVPAKLVYANLITHYNDSCGELCKRIVFTKDSCINRKQYNKSGKQLTKVKNVEGKDYSCYTCFDMEDERVVMMYPIHYKMGFNYDIQFAKAVLQMDGPYCSKPETLLRQRLGDSVAIVFWEKLYPKQGRQVFYTAKDTSAYPYYVASTLDSIVYDLNLFCSNAEIQEEREIWQKLIEKYVEVKITPNPFLESFEMVFTAKTIEIFVGTVGKTLTFYDDVGNILKTQQIVLDQTYTFSFPEVKSGKTIYYKITWPDFVISGQILKS